MFSDIEQAKAGVEKTLKKRELFSVNGIKIVSRTDDIPDHYLYTSKGKGSVRNIPDLKRAYYFCNFDFFTSDTCFFYEDAALHTILVIFPDKKLKLVLRHPRGNRTVFYLITIYGLRAMELQRTIKMNIHRARFQNFSELLISF